jgi:sulfite exporter TauE/SafE
MLYTAFIFGLISSFHCIGMCGPIAMMLPVDPYNQTKKAIQIAVYHFGRLTAYAAIGLFFGILGKGLYIAGLQQKTSIIVGAVMILIVLIPEKKFAEYNFSKPIYAIISGIKTKLGKQFKKRSYKSLFLIGLFNGFLPCGLVYVALFGAIAMQSASWGVLYMVLYGLGTIPLMTFVVYAKSMLTLPFRDKIQKAVPFVAVAMGVLFILRGLGLGIPYVSPADISLFVQATPNCR